MAAPYSKDLRQRVIEKSKAGRKVSEITAELNVSKTFIYDMLALEQKTGDVKPKKGKPGPKPIIGESDLERIRETIESTPDMTWKSRTHSALVPLFRLYATQ